LLVSVGLLQDWFLDNRINFQISGVPVCKGFFKKACGFHEDTFDKILMSVLEDKCGAEELNPFYRKLLGKRSFTAATGKEYSEHRIRNDRVAAEQSKAHSNADDVVAFLDDHFANHEDSNPQQK
jgi:hypothetical protein